MKTAMRLAAGLWMIAAAAMAQVPDRVITPEMLKAETARIQTKSLSVPASEMAKRMMTAPYAAKLNMNSRPFVNSKVVKSAPLKLNGLRPAQPKLMTRAAKFGAYYERPLGVFNLKAGMDMTETEYTKHGLLLPIMQDIEFTDASTGAANIDWLVEGNLSYDKSVTCRYVVNGTDWWTPLPELTAYDAAGNDSIYQYGWGVDIYSEDPEPVQGQGNNVGFGYIDNMDPHAWSFAHTSVLSLDNTWGTAMYGSDFEGKSQYIEFFEKPAALMALNSVFFYVIAPGEGSSAGASDLSTKEFGVTPLILQNGEWATVSDRVSTKAVALGNLDEAKELAIWYVEVYFKELVWVDTEFALLFDGPQDGTVGWGIPHQIDRAEDGVVTAGYIPQAGEYAGQILPYGMYNSAGEVVPYPTSLDIALQVFMPYNMFIDPESSTILNSVSDVVYVETGESAFSADTYIWNWSAYLFNGIIDAISMKVTSDSDWLTAEITETPNDQSFAYNVRISATASTVNRAGTLTFTDGLGYTDKLTIYQIVDPAGIDAVKQDAQTQLDPNAPVYDLTGRQVSNPVKGIYLQNGKKFVVE